MSPFVHVCLAHSLILFLLREYLAVEGPVKGAVVDGFLDVVGLDSIATLPPSR
jgi:hypothetical protein